MVTQARTARRRSSHVRSESASGAAAGMSMGRPSPGFGPLPECVSQVEETCPTVRPGSFSLRITKQGKLQVLCFEAPVSHRHG